MFTKPQVEGMDGSVRRFVNVGSCCFEIEHKTTEEGYGETFIRPDQSNGCTTRCPDWFPNKWPCYSDVLEPRACIEILEQFKEHYDNAVCKGGKQARHIIRQALGIK